MRTIRLNGQKVDAAQLQDELNAAGLAAVTVAGPDAQGDVVVTSPDDVDGTRLDPYLRNHFPRALLLAILAVDFEGVDFDTPTTLAGLKVALNQHRQRCVQLRNRTAAALRARWE
jgi:hypothetical protein